MDDPLVTVFSDFADAFHILDYQYGREERERPGPHFPPKQLVRQGTDVIKCDEHTTVKVAWYDVLGINACSVGLWYPTSRVFNWWSAVLRLRELYPNCDPVVDFGYLDVIPGDKSAWERDIDAGRTCLVECGSEYVADYLATYLATGSLGPVGGANTDITRGKLRSRHLPNSLNIEEELWFNGFCLTTNSGKTVCGNFAYIDSAALDDNNVSLDDALKAIVQLYPATQVIHISQLAKFIDEVDLRADNRCHR